MELFLIVLSFNIVILATFGAIMEDDWQTWPISELEKQMSPSRWNPTKTAEQVINEYVNNGIAETEKCRKNIPVKLDVPYSNGLATKLDIYGINLPADSPIFFFVHGGYWQEGSKNISGGMASNALKCGVKTVVFGYTLAPAAKIKQMQREFTDALKYIINLYPKSKIIVGGHSAGGQMCASLLYMSKNELPTEMCNNIVGLVLISGVFDLRPLVSTYVNGALQMTPNEAESLSPLRQHNRINPDFQNRRDIKCLMMVGKYDSPEFQRQSEAYKDVLSKVYETKLWRSEKDDHFTLIQHLADDNEDSGKKLHEFLQQFKSGSSGSCGGIQTRSVVTPVLLSVLYLIQLINFL